MENTSTVEMKLDVLIEIMQQMLAIELSKQGMTHEEIRQRLHVGKATVNEMLKGIKKDK
jgi:predicted transcriptional regulator